MKEFIKRLGIYILLAITSIFLINRILSMPYIKYNFDRTSIFFFFFMAIFLYSIKKDLKATNKIDKKEFLFFFTIFLFTQIIGKLLIKIYFISVNLNGQVLVNTLYLMRTVDFISVIFLFPGFFSFRYSYALFKKHEMKILKIIIFFLLALMTSLILHEHWILFSKIVAISSSKILPNSQIEYDPNFGTPILTYKNFSVDIGAPCSGIESLSLFIFVMLALFSVKKIKERNGMIILIFGSLGMLSINILRISILMIIGAETSKELAIKIFHENIGWLFYMIYLILFLYFALPKIILDNQEP